MKKRALNLNPADAWQGLRENPLTGTAMSIGSFVPGVGGAISAGDMLNNLYRGNLASAGLNAVQTAAGFVPGGSHGASKLVTGLASKGRLGRVAAKALPYIAPMAGDPKTTGLMHQITSAVPAVGTQMIDQARAMNRPAYQKQLKDQEQTMREFNEWRRHKATLQQMAQEQPPDAEPQVKEALDAYSAGEMGSKLWGLHNKAFPYTTTALVAGQMYPGYINEDIPGMLRGAVRGGGAVAGATGGFMGGGLVGNAIGAALAKRFGADPRMAGNIGATAGSTLGTLLGHYAGRKTFGAAVDDEDSPLNLRRLLKSSSFKLLKLAAAGGEQASRQSKQDMALKRIAHHGESTLKPTGTPTPKQLKERMAKGNRAGAPKPPEPKAPPASVDPAAATMAATAPAAPPLPTPPPMTPPPAAAVPPTPPPQMGGAPGIGDPARTGSFGAFPNVPTVGEAIMRHPMMAFASRHKVPLVAGSLATAGLGAYLMGRSKRNKEDQTAEAEMAKQGFVGWGGGSYHAPIIKNIGADIGYAHALGLVPYPYVGLRFGEQEGPGAGIGMALPQGLHLSIDRGTKPGWAWKHPRSLWGHLIHRARGGDKQQPREKETPAANPDAVGEK